MGPGWDQTHDPWISNQTHYQSHYTAQYKCNYCEHKQANTQRPKQYAITLPYKGHKDKEL